MPRKARERCDCGCGYSPAAVSRTRVLICSGECGYTLRTSRENLGRGLLTCACGHPIVPACLYDCDIAGDDALYLNPLWQKIAKREENAAQRSARSGSYRPMQCHGCKRFIRSPNEICACGFANDIRAGRNVGRYYESGAPF